MVYRSPRGAVGRLSDHNRSWLRHLLKAGRGIHQVAHHQCGATGAGPDRSLAGEYPHSKLDLGNASGRRQLGNRVHEVEAGTHRSLGVILLGDGGSPHCHHRVADELLQPAAEPCDHLSHGGEVFAEEAAHLLWIPVFGEGRVASQVGEEHRDHPAARHRLETFRFGVADQPVPALAAETVGCEVAAATRRAGRLHGRSAVGAVAAS